MILISWDGYQRNHLDQQLDKGELPNLKTFMENGVRLDTYFIYQMTQTKPAHASMLTGIHPTKLEIYSNQIIFKTVPANTTILERSEHNFKEIKTGFIAGKNKNIRPCFENLTGLGVLRREAGSLSDKDRWYKPLFDLYEPLRISIYNAGHSDGKKYDVVYIESYFKITSYGRMFIDACLKKYGGTKTD